MSDPHSTGFSSYFSRRMIVMIAILAVVLVLVFGWVTFKSIMISKFVGVVQPQTISTVHAQASDWQPQLRAVATLHADQGADLAAEVTGLVTSLNFKPGDDVKAGTLLIQLRDDSDRAQLNVFRAQAALSRRTLERYTALNTANAISQTDYDTARAKAAADEAQVSSQQALVAKKAIRAPYDGRVGIRQVDVGQYVNAGQILVTLQHLDPMFADFLVPQAQMAQVTEGHTIVFTTDGVNGRSFQGVVTALDPKVDPATRNVRVRARIPNPDKSLLPGMFGEVQVDTGAPRRALTVPQTAVVYSPYGDTVYLAVPGDAATQQPAQPGKDAPPNLMAQQRFVTVGETRGDQVEILKGVTAKDIIVSSGQMKLKNGIPVLVNNSNALPNQSAPRVTDQ